MPLIFESDVIPFVEQMKPISVKYGLGIADHDSEGRLVTVEFDSFYLICAYVPNSGDGLKRLVSILSLHFSVNFPSLLLMTKM